jgi:isopenicillin N synthase-like dioxygenase
VEHSQETITVVDDDFVPVIDMSAKDTAEGRASIAKAIGQSCETSGFFTIVGHGVSQDLVDRMYTTTNTFFKLPDAEKDLSASRAGVSGLRRFGASAADSPDKKTPPGLYEAFAVHVTGDLSEEERAKLGDDPATWKIANIWPRLPADFKETWHEYLDAMTQLSADIMRLFALALELDEHFFDSKFDNHVSLLLANYYYPQLEPPPPGQIRRAAHTDWGTLTVLYQEDDLGGLQVLQGTDDWRDIPAIPRSFVVNIGDLMAFWTGGRWASTVHRVVNPGQGNTSSRISIPFFYLPDPYSSIEPMQSFASAADGQPFDRVTVGKWFSHKIQSTFAPALKEEEAKA